MYGLRSKAVIDGLVEDLWVMPAVDEAGTLMGFRRSKDGELRMFKTHGATVQDGLDPDLLLGDAAAYMPGIPAGLLADIVVKTAVCLSDNKLEERTSLRFMGGVDKQASLQDTKSGKLYPLWDNLLEQHTKESIRLRQPVMVGQ